MNKNQSSEELFEEARDWFDRISAQFSHFMFETCVGEKYGEVLGNFVHETCRLAGNVGYALNKGLLPERGKSSRRWADYNGLRTNLGVMELILELWRSDAK